MHLHAGGGTYGDKVSLIHGAKYTPMSKPVLVTKIWFYDL